MSINKWENRKKIQQIQHINTNTYQPSLHPSQLSSIEKNHYIDYTKQPNEFHTIELQPTLASNSSKEPLVTPTQSITKSSSSPQPPPQPLSKQSATTPLKHKPIFTIHHYYELVCVISLLILGFVLYELWIYVFFPSSTAVAPILPNPLVRFQIINGVLKDTSGNNHDYVWINPNNRTYTGAVVIHHNYIRGDVLCSSTVINSALTVPLVSIPSSKGGYTISMWVSIPYSSGNTFMFYSSLETTTQPYRWYMDMNSNIGKYTYSNSHVQYNGISNKVIGIDSIPIYDWTHLTYTTNLINQSFAFYENGNLIIDGLLYDYYNEIFYPPTTPLSFMGSISQKEYNGYGFGGSMDLITVHDVALTSIQVKALYQSTYIPSPTLTTLTSIPSVFARFQMQSDNTPLVTGIGTYGAVLTVTSGLTNINDVDRGYVFLSDSSINPGGSMTYTPFILLNPFMFSLWIKYGIPVGTSQFNYPLLSSLYGFSLWYRRGFTPFNDDVTIEIQFPSSYVPLSYKFASLVLRPMSGIWFLLTIGVTTNSVIVYINGIYHIEIPFFNRAATGYLYPFINPISVYVLYDGASAYFIGRILFDDLRFYNISLTPSQVYYLYQSTVAATSTSLLAGNLGSSFTGDGYNAYDNITTASVLFSSSFGASSSSSSSSGS